MGRVSLLILCWASFVPVIYSNDALPQPEDLICALVQICDSDTDDSIKGSILPGPNSAFTDEDITEFCQSYALCSEGNRNNGSASASTDVPICFKFAACTSNSSGQGLKSMAINLSSVALAGDTPNVCPYDTQCPMLSHFGPMEDDTSHCCPSCSCIGDCAEDGQCCHKGSELLDPLESDLMDCVEIHLPNMAISFNMITKCLNGQTCFENEDALPVSSAATKRIYATSRCADCSGVYDYQHWDIIFFSSSNKAGLQDIPDNIKPYPFSDLHISPPQRFDSAWFNNFICDPIHICNSTNQTANEECDGTWAPVLAYNRFGSPEAYANVACAECNKAHFKPSTTCKMVFYPQYSFGSSKLQVVLEPSAMVKYKEEMSKDVITARSRCVPSSDTVTLQRRCYNLLCPEGMVYLEGKCQYIVQSIRETITSFQVRLIPDSTIYRAWLSNMVGSSGKSIKKWLFNPCNIRTTLRYKVFMATQSQDTSLIDYLIVRIIRDVEGENFKTEINRMQECLEEKWFIKFGDLKTYFSSVLDTYKDYVRDGTEMRKLVASMDPDAIISDSKSVELLAEQFSRYRVFPGFFIKRVHFCNQVELQPDQIEARYNEIVLLYNNVTIGDNAFSVVFHNENDTDNGFSIRLCEDDYLRSTDHKPVTDVENLNPETSATEIKPGTGAMETKPDTGIGGLKPGTSATEMKPGTGPLTEDTGSIDKHDGGQSSRAPLHGRIWQLACCMIAVSMGLKSLWMYV